MTLAPESTGSVREAFNLARGHSSYTYAWGFT